MSDERPQYEKGDFYRVAVSSMPNLASLLPDGMDKPWQKRLLGKLKMAWNFVRKQAIYKSEEVFKGMFGEELRIGDIATPVAVTVFIPDTEQTVTFMNRETDFVNYDLMPHDLFLVRPDLHAWLATSYSSCIPFVFSIEKESMVSPPPSEACNDAAGFPACNVSTVYGFAPVDGAVSAYYGAMGASSNQNKIIVTVFKSRKAQPLDYTSGSRFASWWLIGSAYSLFKAATYMLNNEGEDKLALSKQLGAVELPCAASEARQELKEKTGNEYPNGSEFSKYTNDKMHDIFNYQYDKIRKMIEEDPTYNLEKYAKEGMIICVSSGGAFAVDELAGICALCDAVNERKPEERRGIINLITGTSAGSLNAIYVSQIHDEVYNLNGDNKQ